MIFHGHVIAVQDGYYDFWVERTFGEYTVTRTVPLHFCKGYAFRCREGTVYRHPVHVDVFRILEPDQLTYIPWITKEQKVRIDAYPAVVEASGLTRAANLGALVTL